ncbi:AFG1-like ATPase-domain-containing protein [Gymnopilus junonius]|uniref:AFG1-like ATPase-domain-containing protein n=1 Tax=Gymnopilus junonius TaxID=109634 RepID=A0A9P5NT10_GYMJU|nr:AFG1-like ATPase-domain-containing protein [Gymnopilus junonius]
MSAVLLNAPHHYIQPGLLQYASGKHFRRFRCRAPPNTQTSKLSVITKRNISNLPETDLLEKYISLVTLGDIEYDEEQVRVVMKLRRLQRELEEYAPPALSANLFQPRQPESSDSPWWVCSGQEFGSDESQKALIRLRGHAEELNALETPKIPVHNHARGSSSGKSFLVDLWFESVKTPYKARKHYSQLVLEICHGVWEETKLRKTIRGPWNKKIRGQIKSMLETGTLPVRWGRSNKPFLVWYLDPSIAFMVAKILLLHKCLLVFDEIQFLDVPDELYRKGVQRERLEPFVEALKMRCTVTILDCEKDRRELLSASQPLGQTWFTFDQKTERARQEFHVFGRSLKIPWGSGSACKWTFAELCDFLKVLQSLEPADYFTIAANFPVVAMTDILDQARRFISLIDALYESRCRILCLAETTPDQLFFRDALNMNRAVDAMMVETVAETQHVYRPNVSSYDQPQMREVPAAPKSPLSIDTLSIFSGEEEQIAFKRAISRLKEMTSPPYNRIDRWSPLFPTARKWETRSFTPTEQNATKTPEYVESGEAESDLASEAAYGTLQNTLSRPHAPRPSPDHVWGVRDDWGPAAKDWRKGPKIYKNKGKDDKAVGPTFDANR